MPIRLQIQWPNPSHKLLANPQVVVQVDESPIDPVSSKPGKCLYDVADDCTSVAVSVKFSYTGADGQDYVVLDAEQNYARDGTKLNTANTPVTYVDGTATFESQHPLVDSTTSANAANGLTIAEIRTEFVNVTMVYYALTSGAFTQDFAIDRNPACKLVAVAATSATPPLWFASFPSSLRMASAAAVSTLVFFRPAFSGYTEFDSPSIKGSMYNLGRFLLRPHNENDSYSPAATGPVADAPPRPYWTLNYFKGTGAIRCSFEDAMVNAGKPLVMLHPWPSGTSFSGASTAQLQSSAARILRLLRGMGLVAINQPNVSVGRFGLAGYSAGGPGLFEALLHNRAAVKELYVFDCNKTDQYAASVIAWASHTDDFRLRLTGAWHAAKNKAIAQAVIKAVGDTNVSYHPASLDFWKRGDDGGSPWWEYVTMQLPVVRNSKEWQHQFIVFGGETFVGSEGEMRVDSATCWMEQFLSGSGF